MLRIVTGIRFSGMFRVEYILFLKRKISCGIVYSQEIPKEFSRNSNGFHDAIPGFKKGIDKMPGGNLIAPVSPHCSNPEEFSWRVLELT